MNFKDMLAKISQLSEAIKDTGKGKIHTAEPGGYGRKDDEDDEGKKVKADAPKKGRGRPKKDADASGEVKKYDTKGVGDVFGGGKAPKKPVGTVSKKHSLKEYFDQLDQALLEGETIEKKGGRVHKGTYGTSHEAGDEGVKKVATQRGRGRPKKDADETGEVKNYDFSQFGAKKGVKLPAWDKSKTTKHTMKEDTSIPESELYYALAKFLQAGQGGNISEWAPEDAEAVKKVLHMLKQGDIEQAIHEIGNTWVYDLPSGGLDELAEYWIKKNLNKSFWDMSNKVAKQYGISSGLDEAEQIQIKPASQTQTQVIQQGNKTLGTVNNPQLAQQIKQSIGKGEMSLNPNEEMAEGSEDLANQFAAMARKMGHNAKVRTGRQPDAPVRPAAKVTPSPARQSSDPYADRSDDYSVWKQSQREQGISEVSQQTLQSYRKKAAKQKSDALDVADRPDTDDATWVKNMNIASKRKDGIAAANKRLGVAEGFGDVAKKVGGAVKKVAGKVVDKLGHGSDDELLKDLQKKAGINAQHGKPGMAKQNEEVEESSYSAKAARAGKDIGKPGKEFGKIAAKAGKEYGSKEAGKRVAGAVLSKLRKTNEADLPPHDSLASPLSMEESKKAKPDFLDMDKDGNKKETMKKAISDKKKVKEGMDQRLQAAKLEGRAHGLKGHSHCGKNYDDMEEARMYHEGYKEGLDECYGQMPISGGSVVDENDVVNDMASFGAHTPEMDEGNAFTGALNRTPTGGQFKVGGKTFTDRSSIEESPFFESLDRQLTALLEGKEDVAEGMTVSISKGQQGAPDSVSVSAQDGEADQLLALIKSAGLGLFGGEEQNGYGAPEGTTAAPGGIEVVDDHDGMMALMKKLTGGGEEASSEDYADEEGSSEHEHAEGEEPCNECGMAYESCGCDHEDKEVVDEVESEDQMTYNVAEDNPPDSGAEETEQEVADSAQANSSAASYDEAESEEVEESDSSMEEEEDLTEWANDAGEDNTSDAFEADIDFMTKVISGGLNKQKSTGQTTIPVVASQTDRMHSHNTTDVNESVADWKKLAGIK